MNVACRYPRTPPLAADSTPPAHDPLLTTIQVRGAAGGDATCLDWLVRHLTPWLLAAARYRLGPRLRAICDPEDVVADVWTVTLPRLGELAAREGRVTPVLLKFMSTTLLHRVNRLLERHVFGKPPMVSPGAFATDASGAGLDQIQDLATAVISRAVRSERRTAVLAAIEALSDDDREILILRGIEQQPLAAVAAELELEPGTVAVRFHRALKRLRAALPDPVVEELLAEAGE